MAEPVFSKIHHPIIKYFFAVRPAFLLTTFAGCAAGFASALFGGAQFNFLLMALALMLALISLLPLLISLRAEIFLYLFAAEAHKLQSAIQLTLAAMLIHALLLTMILIWNLR